jgi:hypothetical protein
LGDEVAALSCADVPEVLGDEAVPEEPVPMSVVLEVLPVPPSVPSFESRLVGEPLLWAALLCESVPVVERSSLGLLLVLLLLCASASAERNIAPAAARPRPHAVFFITSPFGVWSLPHASGHLPRSVLWMQLER